MDRDVLDTEIWKAKAEMRAELDLAIDNIVRAGTSLEKRVSELESTVGMLGDLVGTLEQTVRIPKRLES